MSPAVWLGQHSRDPLVWHMIWEGSQHQGASQSRPVAHPRRRHSAGGCDPSVGKRSSKRVGWQDLGKKGRTQSRLKFVSTIYEALRGGLTLEDQTVGSISSRAPSLWSRSTRTNSVGAPSSQARCSGKRSSCSETHHRVTHRNNNVVNTATDALRQSQQASAT